MLGTQIADPDGIEGPQQSVEGLGLLEVTTVMTADKKVVEVSGQTADDGTAVTGYEIHIGKTTGPDCGRPWLEINGQQHGAMSANKAVRGCYVHGLFASDAFRAKFLAQLGGSSGVTDYGASVEQALDDLAIHLEESADLKKLLLCAT